MGNEKNSNQSCLLLTYKGGIRFGYAFNSRSDAETAFKNIMGMLNGIITGRFCSFRRNANILTAITLDGLMSVEVMDTSRPLELLSGFTKGNR